VTRQWLLQGRLTTFERASAVKYQLINYITSARNYKNPMSYNNIILIYALTSASTVLLFRLRNDLGIYCVGLGVKLYSLTHLPV